VLFRDKGPKFRQQDLTDAQKKKKKGGGQGLNWAVEPRGERDIYTKELHNLYMSPSTVSKMTHGDKTCVQNFGEVFED